MENQANTKQTIINYGLILGAASIILSAGIYAAGINLMEQPTWVKILSYVIFIVSIIAGIKKYRDLNNNYLTLGQAMKVGIGIALVGGILSAIYTYIFFSFIDPEIITQIMANAEEKMLDQNPDMTEEQIEMGTKVAKMFMSPFALSTMAIIGSLIMGAIISLIGGLILKKEDTSYNL